VQRSIVKVLLAWTVSAGRGPAAQTALLDGQAGPVDGNGRVVTSPYVQAAQDQLAVHGAQRGAVRTLAIQYDGRPRLGLQRDPPATQLERLGVPATRDRDRGAVGCVKQGRADGRIRAGPVGGTWRRS
jgi:hypothetical protein